MHNLEFLTDRELIWEMSVGIKANDQNEYQNILLRDFDVHEGLYYSKLIIPPKSRTEFTGTINVNVVFEHGYELTLVEDASIESGILLDLPLFAKEVCVRSTPGSVLKSTDYSHLLKVYIILRSPASLNIPDGIEFANSIPKMERSYTKDYSIRKERKAFTLYIENEDIQKRY